MYLSREYMINMIKTRKDKNGKFYSTVKTCNGETILENAPDKNIYHMYCVVCLTGKKSKGPKISKKGKHLVFEF